MTIPIILIYIQEDAQDEDEVGLQPLRGEEIDSCIVA